METRSLTAQEKDAMLYARTGKVEQLKELLAQSGIPASLTAPNASFSLLTLAAKHGHLEMIHWLLKEGADPNWVGYNGCALDEAANWTRTEAILLLREVTSPSAIEHSPESLKRILEPVLVEGKPLDGWRVIEPTGAGRLEFNDTACSIAPVPDLAGFWSFGSVVDFGGETLPASFVSYGRVRIEAEGMNLGALSLPARPLHVPLEPGLYNISGLEPSAYISRYDYPGCSIRDQNFPRVFLIGTDKSASEWAYWGKPSDIPVPRRIVGIMAGSAWQRLRNLALKDDRFWEYLFYGATGTCTNIWSPIGLEINSYEAGNAVVLEASERCRLWTGLNSAGKVSSMLLLCW